MSLRIFSIAGPTYASADRRRALRLVPAAARHSQQRGRPANFRYEPPEHPQSSVYQRVKSASNLRWKSATPDAPPGPLLYRDPLRLAALAALALWIFSRARTPFDYMVVGTLAATAVLWQLSSSW